MDEYSDVPEVILVCEFTNNSKEDFKESYTIAQLIENSKQFIDTCDGIIDADQSITT